MAETFEQRLARAREMDAGDELRDYRDQFHFPTGPSGQPVRYLVGNSLGLQPKRTAGYVGEELEKWRTLGVRGHFEGQYPWMPYHEFLTETMASLVGARTSEVVMMNSLTTNLHLMMATFYRPAGKRRKILIEPQAFPSDYQAAISQIQWHGLSPEDALLVAGSAGDSGLVETDTILQMIEEQADEIALVLLPGVQYYTGQVFEIQAITRLAHRHGITAGFDLAHAAGNVRLDLHDQDVDFAVWCSYKYLNSGPGSVGGCFVHERHATNVELPRLAGWWGHHKESRFLMKNEFQAMPTAEGWQLSNPPILSLAAIRASLDVFAEAGGIDVLVKKSRRQGDYLRDLLQQQLAGRVRVITPRAAAGCQLSLQIESGEASGRAIHRQLDQAGMETDWREPNVIRVAPVPLYNSFEDCCCFVETLRQSLTR